MLSRFNAANTPRTQTLGCGTHGDGFMMTSKKEGRMDKGQRRRTDEDFKNISYIFCLVLGVFSPLSTTSLQNVKDFCFPLLELVE